MDTCGDFLGLAAQLHRHEKHKRTTRLVASRKQNMTLQKRKKKKERKPHAQLASATGARMGGGREEEEKRESRSADKLKTGRIRR